MQGVAYSSDAACAAQHQASLLHSDRRAGGMCSPHRALSLLTLVHHFEYKVQMSTSAHIVQIVI